MTGISGKTVAITGASSGIGEATARLLAERGAAVVLAHAGRIALDQLAEDIRESGGRAVAVATDVTSPEDLRRLVDRAVTEFGGSTCWSAMPASARSAPWPTSTWTAGRR